MEISVQRRCRHLCTPDVTPCTLARLVHAIETVIECFPADLAVSRSSIGSFLRARRVSRHRHDARAW